MDIWTSWSTGYLSTILCLYLRRKNQLKCEKWGKSSEPWSHTIEPWLVILGLAGVSSFSSCYLCRELPRHFKVSVRSRIIIAKYMLQSCYRLSSFIFVFVVQCCSGWVWGNGRRSNEIAKRLTSSFFCNAGTGFCDCGAPCRVFPILFFNSGTMPTADKMIWVLFLQFINFQASRLAPCWMICSLVDAKGWQLVVVGALAKYKHPIVPLSILTFHWRAEWIGNFKETCHISWWYDTASLLFVEACFQQNI